MICLRNQVFKKEVRKERLDGRSKKKCRVATSTQGFEILERVRNILLPLRLFDMLHS